MITFTNRKPEEMLLPFAEGPVHSTTFCFVRMNYKFSGKVDYEWFRLMGGHYLIIHAVIFDNILSEDLQKLVDPLLYNYLVECAKSSSKFQPNDIYA